MTMGVLPFESLVAQGRRRGPPRCLKVSRDNADSRAGPMFADLPPGGRVMERHVASRCLSQNLVRSDICIGSLVGVGGLGPYLQLAERLTVRFSPERKRTCAGRTYA